MGNSEPTRRTVFFDYDGGMRTALALFALISLSPAGDGQGPADMNARVEGLNLGTYWFGSKIDHNDLKGKVVLVEMWGS